MALAVLSGCNGPAQPQQNAATAQGGDYEARLRTMPDGARNAVFIRAIRDAGFECQHVASSTPAGKSGTAAWSAVCTDSGQWIIAIGANGNAQVTRGVPLPPEEEPAG
jgi:hypothetical protein